MINAQRCSIKRTQITRDSCITGYTVLSNSRKLNCHLIGPFAWCIKLYTILNYLNELLAWFTTLTCDVGWPGGSFSKKLESGKINKHRIVLLFALFNLISTNPCLWWTVRFTKVFVKKNIYLSGNCVILVHSSLNYGRESSLSVFPPKYQPFAVCFHRERKYLCKLAYNFNFYGSVRCWFHEIQQISNEIWWVSWNTAYFTAVLYSVQCWFHEIQHVSHL